MPEVSGDLLKHIEILKYKLCKLLAQFLQLLVLGEHDPLEVLEWRRLTYFLV